MLVRGVELDVVVDGEGDGGRTFVWGHGLTSNAALEREGGYLDWRTPPGWRVVRYDARGHGRSGWQDDPATQTWDQLGLDMLAVATAVGAGRFVAGGASMGCATTLYAAVAAPERVEAMVLVIPPTAWATRAAQVDLYRRGYEYLEEHGLESYLERQRTLPQSEWYVREMPEARDRRLAHVARMDPKALATVLRAATLSDLPAPDDLRRLTMPVLILAWADDTGHPLETAETLADVLPAASLQVARRRSDVDGWTGAVETFLGSV